MNWHEHAERNSKYFFNLERSRANARTCSKILLPDGTETTEGKEILKQQTLFYCELYKKDPQVDFSLREGDAIPKIDNIKQQMHNMPFSFHEVSKATAAMKNNKTSGPDGLPIELYKMFWQQIGPVFYSTLHEMYQDEEIYREAKKGILNLIPKAGKDTRKLCNLRPITLLNADYKIIEKCIANRMDQEMDSIINEDQKGFMKGRRISTNIRKLLDLMRYAEDNQTPAFILSLDFRKCFDLIGFGIIQGSLEAFGFPEYIRNWVRMLYTDFTVKIQNNGHLSNDIKIQRSVHQGGCCSSYLFLCCAELLAIKLRSNKDIKGIPVDDLLFLLNQFADDTDVTALHDQISLDNILQELKLFHEVSGFEVSYDKTAVLRIGSMKNSSAELYTQKPLAWKNSGINVLGVDICNNEENLHTNYEKILPRIVAILGKWTHRGLSLLGKVTIINTLISSLFVYKMTVLPDMSQKFINTIEAEINKFIWNGRRAKIPLRILKAKKSSRGVDLVDLKTKQRSIKITWVQILKSDPKHAALVYNNIAKTLKEDIWNCDLNSKDIESLGIDQFWMHMLQAWNLLKANHEQNRHFIWLNSRIRMAGKPVLWDEPYHRGLKWTHKLYEKYTTNLTRSS